MLSFFHSFMLSWFHVFMFSFFHAFMLLCFYAFMLLCFYAFILLFFYSFVFYSFFFIRLFFYPPIHNSQYTYFNSNTPHRDQKLNYLARTPVYIRLKTVSNRNMASFDHGHSDVYFCPNISPSSATLAQHKRSSGQRLLFAGFSSNSLVLEELNTPTPQQNYI